jgi:hypothetical protein
MAVTWLGVRRNPLRRRVDRVEVLAWVLAAVLLCCAVPASLAAGSAVQRHQLAVRAAGAHPVTATVLADVGFAGFADGVSSAAARVAWTRDGEKHIGVVAVPPPEHAGDKLRIWVDDTGRTTPPPLSDQAIASQRDGMVVLCLLGSLVALTCLLTSVRLGLDRLRYARWDRDWRRVTADDRLFEP